MKYLKDEFGPDFAREYFIWDLAAGTGNLLAQFSPGAAGRIFASDIDEQHTRIMRDLARAGQLPLREEDIFVFDFLNDYFYEGCDKHAIRPEASARERASILDQREECKACDRAAASQARIPPALREIISDPAKRKKLIILINPPYAEAGTARTITGTGKSKDGVATTNRIYKKYKDQMGKASNELFAQFFCRIARELPGCVLASFATAKYINATNFIRFREGFRAKFLRGFLCPSYSFDNVRGAFPISFAIWDLGRPEKITTATFAVFDAKKNLEERRIRGRAEEGPWALGTKTFYAHEGEVISQWMRGFAGGGGELCILYSGNNDFQAQHTTYLANRRYHNHSFNISITKESLIPALIFLAVRHSIRANWLNDRAQFLAPQPGWEGDVEFHFDCLAFALFCGQNKISCEEGKNYFIPFSREELGAGARPGEEFMRSFLAGKEAVKEAAEGPASSEELFAGNETLALARSLIPSQPVSFSPEAEAVMGAGRELFAYYHRVAQEGPLFALDDLYERKYRPSAGLYDIRAHFQGFSQQGDKERMRSPAASPDEKYKELLAELNQKLKILGDKIAKAAARHGFLRG